MKNQFLKVNSTRSMNLNNSSTNQTINKSQLTSRLKVIEFLKDQLYPTGKRKENKNDLFIFCCF